MAAVTAPERTARSINHYCILLGWSDEKVLAKVREMDSHDAKAMGIPTRTVTSASIHYQVRWSITHWIKEDQHANGRTR